jgi:nicotinate-nucleotide--dimethylbenzimidazole phosphoribosyltransferase
LLEEVGARLAGIFGTLDVRLKNKIVVTCAGDHGICEEGVSLFPSEVTPQMVYNFVHDGASINVLARHAGAGFAWPTWESIMILIRNCPFFTKKLEKAPAILQKGPP